MGLNELIIFLLNTHDELIVRYKLQTFLELHIQIIHVISIYSESMVNIEVI